MILNTDGIDHLNLEVINLEKTVKFYSELLGFEVKKEQHEEDSKIIGNDKVKLCLYENKNMQKYVKKGFAHFGLHINNFDDVINKCKEMGIDIYYGGPLEWENSSSIYIQDPNGYEIELSKTFGGGL
ncbi:MAG: VOC family protein [Ignavibacteriales bacterium CG12_big_fil_rev_8_21_14_0_65_30_8]|nr:MAG: VOC family protein [Ignavibacteriales bacterium CG12_big_fil_rev_8_21_14_0_65_30_8]